MAIVRSAFAFFLGLILLPSYASDELKIENFRQGLISFNAQRVPYIYKAGGTFPYQFNGTCVAAGKDNPCVWHGFEFSYVSQEEVTRIDCVSQSSEPTTNINPNRVIAQDVQYINWGFNIYGKRGNYIRPQYTFNVGAKALSDWTRCSYKGKEILSFTFVLFPLR
jgi:hypothetical protein